MTAAPSLILSMFWYQNFLQTMKGSSTKCFGTVRQKLFDGKSWYSPSPFLIHKPFHKGKFSETQHRTVALRNVTEVWDKTILMEYRDNSHLFYPLQLSIPEIFWNTKRFPLQKFSALWDKNFSTEILDTPAPPFLIHKLFRKRKSSETQHRMVALRNVTELWDKTI